MPFTDVKDVSNGTAFILYNLVWHRLCTSSSYCLPPLRSDVGVFYLRVHDWVHFAHRP